MWQTGTCTDKKEKKIFLIYKEIPNGAVAKSYMTNGLLNMTIYLRISSYIRKPFLIYDFATAPFCISLYLRNIWFSILSVHTRRSVLQLYIIYINMITIFPFFNNSLVRFFTFLKRFCGTHAIYLSFIGKKFTKQKGLDYFMHEHLSPIRL